MWTTHLYAPVNPWAQSSRRYLPRLLEVRDLRPTYFPFSVFDAVKEVARSRQPEYHRHMSPTVFRWRGYRFFFFSREEERMHVHVYCADGEAKLWLDPEVELARNYGLRSSQLSEVRETVEEHRDEIARAWREHFRR